MNLNKAQQNQVRITLHTEGWLYVQQMMKDAIMDIVDPLKTNIEGKTNEMLATDVKGAVMAAGIYNDLMKKLNVIENISEHKNKKEPYT